MGARTRVHRAERESDGRTVILKSIERDAVVPGVVARYQHEFEVLETLRIPGVVQALDMEVFRGVPVLVLEDVGAASLAKHYQGKRLDPDRVVFLGARIAEVLARIHDLGVVHCDLNPANILIREDSDEVFIADFGWSVRTAGRRSVVRGQVAGGTLAYSSPEQTGRTARTVDHRTDLYSLGITLYQLLTGRLPFTSDDPLEMVHSHLARRARPVHELIRGVPRVVSDIVDKLMAKMPEDRYQTARGLAHDLRECERRLDAAVAAAGHGSKGPLEIAPFALGQHDEPGYLELSHKLHGREPEARLVRAAMNRVMAGSRELLIVTGRSGIGKSTLIRDLATSVVGAHAYFVSGKADPYRRTVPYLALAQALGDLMRQFLTESPERLRGWQRILRQSLGASAQVLVEMVPELGLVIGPQPVVPRVDAAEMENRFHHLFQRFLDAICTVEHPLIVFLDDLQWADAATSRLMKRMIDDPAVGHLLLIGSYRTEEVGENHPLLATLDQIRSDHPGAFTELTLGPLGRAPVGRLLGDTLERSPEDCAELADVVHRKTGGNPFFIAQFLVTLHQDGALVFDHEVGGWRWDMAVVQGFGITDNMAEIVVARLRRLPEATVHALRLAASVGHTFRVKTLATVSGEHPDALYQSLTPALDQGFLRPAREGALMFSHDRVRQAVYASMTEDEKAAQHRRIARSLLDRLGPEQRTPRIFEIAEHLAASKELITDDDERLEVAQVCYDAGRQALQSTAYEGALEFLRVALECMPESGWSEHYEFMRDLVLANIQAEYLNDDEARAARLAEYYLHRARDDVDRIAPMKLAIGFHIVRHQMREVLDICIAALAELGVDLPEAAAERAALVMRVRAELAARSVDLAVLDTLPELTDPRAMATVRIIHLSESAAFFLDAGLMQVFNSIALSVCVGHAPSALMATQCINHAYQLIVTGEVDEAIEFGSLGERLIDRFEDEPALIKAALNYHVVVRPWAKAIRQSLQPLADLVHRGLQVGELEFGFYAACFHAVFRLFVSEPLDDIQREMTRSLGMMARHRMVLHRDFLLAWKRGVDMLLDQSDDDAPDLLQVPFIEFFAHSSESMVHTVMGDDRAALAAAERAEEHRFMARAQPSGVEHDYFYCLAGFASHDALVTTDPERARAIRGQIDEKRAAIAAWAERVPENFGPRHDLLAAEHVRLSGDVLAAMAAYDRAIESARRNGHSREEGLACERAARFYQGLGRARIADAYRADAYRAYRRWGARAKVRQLEARNPELARMAGSSHESSSGSGSSSSSTALIGHRFDLESVVRASQALSSELVLDQLAAAFMKIIIENAGAQRGYLLLVARRHSDADDGPADDLDDDLDIQLTVAAEGDIDSETYRALPSLPVDDQTIAVARTVVSYVARSKASLVLRNRAEQAAYGHDPYIQRQRPRAILCAPIERHDELVGVIYLENNRTWDAFTSDRLGVVGMLATQAAISIENARLLEDLERSKYEAERANQAKSLFLAHMNHELRTPMNGVIGMLDSLLDVVEDREQRHYLDIAKTSAAQLMRVVRDTLDLSRIEAGKLELEPVCFSLSDTMSTLERMFSSMLLTRELTFRCHVDDDVPDALIGDRDRLLQVFINLLGNAIKFTPSGGAISVRVTAVESAGGAVVLGFTVRDTGVGIAPAERANIFQPYMRAQAASPSVVGSGLGLSIASNLVATMHGEISVESEIGRGSEFRFTARFELQHDTDEDARDPTTDARTEGVLRVLIVEDNEVNRMVAVRRLRNDGHECQTAANGKIALEMLAAQSFDVVFMDVQMPIMDGYAATREIRRRERESGHHTPIIAVTASATTDVVEACKDAGMDHFVSKPLQIEAIRAAIREVVGRG